MTCGNCPHIMFLKNYTSDVPVAQTIHKIEQVLIRCGVSGITKEYGPGGSISAMIFHVPSPVGGSMAVRLPARVHEAQEALWLDYVDGDKLSADGQSLLWNARKKKSKKDFLEQGERTAWKLVQDWIEVQMSMVQMKQAEVLQVFMSYIWDGKRTFYDQLKGDGFKMLGPAA